MKGGWSERLSKGGGGKGRGSKTRLARMAATRVSFLVEERIGGRVYIVAQMKLFGSWGSMTVQIIVPGK